jgi:putative oxidoreductase
MLQTTRNSPISELTVWAPLVLAILRIVSALLLIDQGLITLLHFPQAGVPDALDAGAGVIEVVGGVLIAVGLYTRIAALAAAAEMAIAYGALDRPDMAILFCVIFFYLVFAGPGMWSLDGRIHRAAVPPLGLPMASEPVGSQPQPQAKAQRSEARGATRPHDHDVHAAAGGRHVSDGGL